MYGAWAKVWVKEIEDNSRILIDWGDDDETTTVEFRFVPYGDDATYVRVTETGHTGHGDEVAARAADSTGGFTSWFAHSRRYLSTTSSSPSSSMRIPRVFSSEAPQRPPLRGPALHAWCRPSRAGS